MISRVFIDRPRLAMVVSIVLTLAGILSIFALPVEMYPKLAPPQIVVTATYPGASAEVIADAIDGKVVLIDPLARDYIENIRGLMVELIQAME